MKIGISLLSARPHRTGVENVALNLITQLGRMDGEDEYVVYADTRNVPWLSNVPGRIRIVDVRLSCRRSLWTWEHLFFLTSRRPKEVDVVHFPIGGGVVAYHGKFVLTIHDIKHYSNRELVKLRRHLLWRLWLKANLHRAAKIITVSEQVKRDILREFPVCADSIRVIPNGVDQRFRPTAGTQVFRAKYRFPERYVLFVGQTQTNKNIRRAIDAITVVRKKYGLDHQFIVAGMPSEDDARLKKYVDSNNLRDTVRFIGYVDDNDLPELYANAELFLFPSLTEGFGIPPLEAMGCGVPVVAAHASCLPEVLGDAAIWVNPLSVASIAEGVATALLDKKARSMAIAKGLSRVKQFTWEKMAFETVNVYRKVAGSSMMRSPVRDSGDATTACGRVGSQDALR
ncbi:MAG: glycosyltransferase family 1 protein [Candidatus Sulfotelmatobacter sp.]